MDIKKPTCHPDRKHHARGLCKTCYNKNLPKSAEAKNRKKQTSKAWSDANKDKVRDSHFKNKYGVTFLEVQALKVEQKNCCAICEEPTKNLQLDHHHDTETVRGMLCGRCNRGLGMFMESMDVMMKAIQYLQFWGTRLKEK